MPASPIILAFVAASTVMVASAPAFNTSATTAAPAVDVACTFNAGMALDTRQSPLDSVQVALGGGTVKVCYGAPSARGRTMIGGDAIPFGTLWRFGANEPTTLHTTVPLNIGGVQVPAGSVVLYALPDRGHWEVFVTASTGHWGNGITPEVRAQEIGSLHGVPTRPADAPVETLRFSFGAVNGNATTLVMEWESTRLEIPIRAAAPNP
jgi:hypothetical protein